MKYLKNIRFPGLIWALLIVNAINANEDLIIGAESDNSLLNFVSKLASTIFTVNILDILTLIGCLFLIVYVRKNCDKTDLWGIIVAVVLAFLYIWTFSYKYVADTSILFGNSYQVFLTLFLLTGYSCLFYFSFEAICVFSGKLIKGEVFPEFISSESGRTDRMVFIIVSLMMLIGWMFWILMNYPGSVSGDGVGQLGQFFENNIGTHHPPLSTFLMAGLTSLGGILVNRDFGIFLYLAVQAVIAAMILGYSVSRLYVRGLHFKACIAIGAFFSFLPIFGAFAQYFEKDMLYSLFTLLFLVLLSGHLSEDEPGVLQYAFLFAAGILCCLLRNNGIYAVIPAYFVILLFFRKQNTRRNRFIIVTVATIVLYFLVNSVMFPLMHFEKGSVREALSLPMQQTARYMVYHGDDITEDEMEGIRVIFPQYEEVPGRYNPTCADPVKDIAAVKPEHLSKYLKTWFVMGFKHPGVYFDAFINTNYGYLAPNEQNVEPALHSQSEGELADMGIVHPHNEIREQILSKLVYINVVFPFIRYFTMPGFYTWLMIVILVILIKQKCYKGLILCVPNIINILVCLASPLCNGLRYELPVVLSLFYIVAFSFITAHEKTR